MTFQYLLESLFKKEFSYYLQMASLGAKVNLSS